MATRHTLRAFRRLSQLLKNSARLLEKQPARRTDLHAATEAIEQLETDLTFEGRTFRRLDIGLDGKVEGYLTKTGDYKEYLTNAPDLVFAQTADP